MSSSVPYGAAPADAAPVFSLEFFPPRDAAAQDRLVRSAQQLHGLRPHFASVTFGAGGSTRDGTMLAVDILQKLGYQVAPHLSCIGSTKESLREILAAYRQAGIRRLVALRGDMPSGMGDMGELRYARDLVDFVRRETGDWFHIEVAAYPEMHPQASGPDADLEHFVEKMRAGANSAITQYFFNADAYFDFVDRATAKGVLAPIVPGIMPITNYTQLARFSDMCGAEIPRWIKLRLASYGDDKASLRAFGHDVVAGLCQDLLDGGAPGLHFYTMNQAEATLAIWKEVGPPPTR
ncbi:5,10-methylenetetrahydrofolate reductase [Pigmentiphaga humi]|uniref:Methylenetetrahydrofolate reductase n=1 Tax=Pigmentiphaga humi TaxID=2478468 RepID=A0A3P4AYZ4_9BURK|nr:methylenetetrahydrofolate reductase [NAD(P)H] [Pigmentiphaga humi]VCU68055.1 5,10-methylenetetrahydrofolate reductase [Pigmentiphaga humi]